MSTPASPFPAFNVAKRSAHQQAGTPATEVPLLSLPVTPAPPDDEGDSPYCDSIDDQGDESADDSHDRSVPRLRTCNQVIARRRRRIVGLASLAILVLAVHAYWRRSTLGGQGWFNQAASDELWDEQDRALRDYRFETPEVHSSLTGLLDRLTPEDKRRRSWLLEQRLVSERATPIGLAAPYPLGYEIRELPGTHPKTRKPRPNEGPGVWGETAGGSKDKYDDLLVEWHTGRQALACPASASTWQKEYTGLHAAILAEEREPKLVEYVCEAQGAECGGLADRLLGMLSTFWYGLVSGRAVSFKWEQPCPLSLLFDSPAIDWSRPFYPNSTTPVAPVYANETVRSSQDSTLTLINGAGWSEYWRRTWPGADVKTPWVQYRDFNRGAMIRSLKSPSWVQAHKATFNMTIHNVYTCVTNYLFRPKPAVQAFIAQYSSYFALPSVFAIGIQIRTGDASITNVDADTKNTVARYSFFFDCAAQVAATYAKPTQKIVYYLMTDSQALEQDALRNHADKVVITGLPPTHVELSSKSGHWNNEAGRVSLGLDGFMRTIAESWTFSHTDFQIISKDSGFGKIPIWMRGRDNSTIMLRNFYYRTSAYALEKLKAEHGGMLPVTDCTKPEALTTFAGLASEWSLG